MRGGIYGRLTCLRQLLWSAFEGSQMSEVENQVERVRECIEIAGKMWKKLMKIQSADEEFLR